MQICIGGCDLAVCPNCANQMCTNHAHMDLQIKLQTLRHGINDLVLVYVYLQVWMDVDSRFWPEEA